LDTTGVFGLTKTARALCSLTAIWAATFVWFLEKVQKAMPSGFAEGCDKMIPAERRTNAIRTHTGGVGMA
jgi:hypothetical protein